MISTLSRRLLIFSYEVTSRGKSLQKKTNNILEHEELCEAGFWKYYIDYVTDGLW